MNNVTESPLIQEIQIAIFCHQDGDLKGAESLYRSILAKDPDQPTVLNNLSLLVGEIEAIQFLNRALSIVPDYLDALINLSMRCQQAGFLDTAVRYALLAKTKAPNDHRVNKLVETLDISDRAHNPALRQSSLKYSVIVPTHNRARLLERALLSIKRQNFESRCEIVVISDLADEATDDVCRRLLATDDIYVRRSGNPGPAESRNLGIKLASGDIILFLDDDDEWHNEFLSNLDSCSSIGKGQVIYFDCTVAIESRHKNAIEIHEEKRITNIDRLNEEVFVKNQISNSCLAYPAAKIKSLSFDANLRAYEDWDFLLAVCNSEMPKYEPILGPIIHEVRDSTTDRRGSTANANNFNAVLDYLHIYRRHPTSQHLQKKRANLLMQVGLQIDSNFL